MVRFKLLARLILKNPSSLFNFLHFWSSRITRAVNPKWRGVHVAIVGSDGSGKSTVSKLMLEKLAHSPYKSKNVYMGWRGSRIPFLKSLMRADKKAFKNKQGDVVSKSGMFLVLRSIGISIIYFIEMYFRYFTKILPSLQMGTTVITDRYFYDRLILDERLPDRIRNTLSKFIPKPDLKYYLASDPDTLHKRQKGLTKKQIQKQVDLLEQNYKKLNITKIDNTVNIDKTLSRILTDFWARANILL